MNVEPNILFAVHEGTAFWRGISTRQVGRVVATITGKMVSAQTVSKLTRDLDESCAPVPSGAIER